MKIQATRLFAIPMVIAAASCLLGLLIASFLLSLGTTITCLHAKAKGNADDFWIIVMAIPVLLISGLLLVGVASSYMEIQNRTGTYGGRGGSNSD